MYGRELAHRQTRASQVQVSKLSLGAEGPAVLPAAPWSTHTRPWIQPRLWVTIPPTQFQAQITFSQCLAQNRHSDNP